MSTVTEPRVEWMVVFCQECSCAFDIPRPRAGRTEKRTCPDCKRERARSYKQYWNQHRRKRVRV